MALTVLDQTTDVRPGRVLSVMCAGMFLVLLDVTIVNVALPDIAQGLHASVPSLQWTIDGYAVAIASLLLAGGSIGDRLGHRRVLVTGFVIFGLASLACAMAPNIGALVAGRIAQGVGGALLLPSTMAVIADVYPERGPQARALGTWAAVSSLALPAGPLLGGLLVGTSSWRLVFWINVPLVAITLAATLAVVPTSTGRARGRVDAEGLIGLIIALAAFVFTIISIGRGTSVLEPVLAGLIALGALVWTGYAEWRAQHPILPLDLLRRREFLSPNAVALTMNLVFNGLLFTVMLYLQDVRGFSPVRAGLIVLPLAVPLVALAPVSGRLTARRGPRTAVSLGCLIAAPGGLFLLGLGVDSGVGWLLIGFGVLGCGAGLVTASVVAAAVRATPADRSGLATGVSNTARQVGTATGVALFGVIAGQPGDADGFVKALHVLGIVATGLWLIAFVVAVRGVGSAD